MTGRAPRPELTGAARRLTTLAGMLLLTACAGQQPAPSGTPAPPIEPQVEAQPGPAEQPAPAPRTRSDASAPTLALLRQSERSAESGDVAAAIAYVERAIRLNPQDGALWLRLAQLHLDAGEPAVAEQFAHKALTLAGDDLAQQRSAWLLVADAREGQGDAAGAAEIRARWRSYRG